MSKELVVSSRFFIEPYVYGTSDLLYIMALVDPRNDESKDVNIFGESIFGKIKNKIDKKYEEILLNNLELYKVLHKDMKEYLDKELKNSVLKEIKTDDIADSTMKYINDGKVVLDIANYSFYSRYGNNARSFNKFEIEERKKKKHDFSRRGAKFEVYCIEKGELYYIKDLIKKKFKHRLDNLGLELDIADDNGDNFSVIAVTKFEIETDKSKKNKNTTVLKGFDI